MKKTALISFLILSMLASCGQAQTRKPQRCETRDSLLFAAVDTSYAFINYGKNHLAIEGDSTLLRRFAAKWWHTVVTGQGNVNIVQIGASHVQGGTFPHQIRRNMLLGPQRAAAQCHDDAATALTGPRGMLFPYSAAVKCNNPFDYKVFSSRPLILTRNVYKQPEAALGLCGIAVTASDTVATILISMAEKELDFRSTTITLFGESKGGVVPQLRIREASGDTLTLSPASHDSMLRRFVFRCSQPVDTFTVVLPCDAGQSFTLTGIYLDNEREGITFHSIGVNGASVSDYLTNFDSVVFKNNYLQLVDSIKKINPDCAFIFITNNDSYRLAGRKRIHNTNGALARDAFYRVARACGGAVWDQYDIMGGSGSMLKWNANDLAQKDKVHFTRKGYQLMGDMISNAMFEMLVAMKPHNPASALPTVAADNVETTLRPEGGENTLRNADSVQDADSKYLYRKSKDRKKVKKEQENEGPRYISY